jgi:hypothetical protein
MYVYVIYVYIYIYTCCLLEFVRCGLEFCGSRFWFIVTGAFGLIRYLTCTAPPTVHRQLGQFHGQPSRGAEAGHLAPGVPLFDIDRYILFVGIIRCLNPRFDCGWALFAFSNARSAVGQARDAPEHCVIENRLLPMQCRSFTRPVLA